MAKSKKQIINLFCFLILTSLFSLGWSGQASSSLLALLPEVPGWQLAEEPQLYQPDNLFEYINGAAESYLSYEFKELVVAQYRRADSAGSLTVEIYRMGSAKNAFGIYSAERYPESRFLEVGAQGYMEDGTLNFVQADKYVKLLSFEPGEETEEVLQLFARQVERAAGEKGTLPEPLQCFPRQGLVPNSEKFILRNFLGYSFLHDGYSASYRVNGEEFELFLIEGKNGDEASAMLEQFVTQTTKRGKKVEKIKGGYHLQDPYLQNIYMAKIKNYIAGVVRIRQGFEQTGLRYLSIFLESLKEKTASSGTLRRRVEMDSRKG